MKAETNKKKTTNSEKDLNYINIVSLSGALCSMNKSSSGKLLTVTIESSADGGEHKQRLNVNFFEKYIDDVEEVLEPLNEGDQITIKAYVTNTKYNDRWTMQLVGSDLKAQ